MTTRKTLQLFCERDLPVSKKDTDLPTLLRASEHGINNITSLTLESFDSGSWQQKIKEVKLRSKNSSRSKDFTSDELTLELVIDQHLMNKGFRLDLYFIANLSFKLLDFCVYRPDL